MEQRGSGGFQLPPIPPRITRKPLPRPPGLAGNPGQVFPSQIEVSSNNFDRNNELNVATTYKKLMDLVVQLIEPDEISRTRVEEIIYNAPALSEMERTNSLTSKQERLLTQFIRTAEGALPY